MKLSPEQIAEAGRLHAEGWMYARIGEKFGVNRQTIKRALDPEYRARRCLQVREALKRRRGIEGVPAPRIGREPATSINVHIDAAARLAEIPPDTRTLTQRLCGDPIPGDPRRAQWSRQ